MPAFFHVSNCVWNVASELIVSLQYSKGAFQQRNRLWTKTIHATSYLFFP